MKKQSTTIASIVILIIIAIFALLNTATVVVNLFGAQVKMPLVLLIFICLLIGAIIIYLLSFSNHLKTNKQLKELQSSRVSKDELKKYQKVSAAEEQRNHILDYAYQSYTFKDEGSKMKVIVDFYYGGCLGMTGSPCFVFEAKCYFPSGLFCFLQMASLSLYGF